MKSLPWLALIGWGAFLYYGYDRASHVPAVCTSVRALPPNHQFVPGDLKCAPPGYEAYFVGMYATGGIDKDAAVTNSAVGAAPTVPAQKEGVIVEVLVAPRPSKDLDAGSAVDVRAGGTTKARARVIAFLCSPLSTTCAALLAVPRESAKDIQPGGTYEVLREEGRSQ